MHRHLSSSILAALVLCVVASTMATEPPAISIAPGAPQPVLPEATVDKLLKADPGTRQRALTLARQALDGLQKADAVLAESQKQSLQTTGAAMTREMAKPRTGTESGSPQALADKGSKVLNEALQQRRQLQQQITQLAGAIARLEGSVKPAATDKETRAK